MKKIIIFAALTTTVLLLTGCLQKKSTDVINHVSTETPTIQEQKPAEEVIYNDIAYTYTNKEKGFTLTLPNERTFQENVFGSLVMFFAPESTGDTVKENLGVLTETLSGTIDLNAYVELTKGNVESVINEYSFVSQDGITIGDTPAIKLIYKGSQSAQNLQWQQVMFLKDNTVYIFTYTATQDTFKDFSEAVNSIITSFSL